MKKLWSRLRLFSRIRHFIPFLKAFFLSSEVPAWKKLLAVAGFVGYWLLPFDIIPDFFFLFGIVDDIAILMLIMRQIIRLAPASMREQYQLSA